MTAIYNPQKYTPPLRKYSSKKWKGKTQKELRDEVANFYQKSIRPHTIKNKHKGITIQFNTAGKGKTKQKITPQKAVIIEHLLILLSEAKLNNIGTVKETHGKDALCFLNFKIVCYIDGVKRGFIASVIVRTNGKFQYSLHESFPKETKVGS